MRYCKTCILLAIIVFSQPPAEARLLNVPEDYQTIQSAINDASNCGDTILVQPGIYHECLIIRSGSFLLTSLISTTGDARYIDSTIVEADSIACAVSIYGGNVHIRGLTITEGYQSGSFGGGGIRCSGGVEPLLEDLLITRNMAGSKGGGVHSTESAHPRLVRCRIIGNRSSYGAGVSAYGGDIDLQDCILSENYAYSRASAIYAASNVSLERVLVANNTSGQFGVTILVEPLYNEVSLSMDKVTIYGNHHEEDQYTAAIQLYNQWGNIEFTASNSIIWGNDCPGLSSDDYGYQRYPSPYLNVSIDYCDIENGYENLEIGEGSTLDWGDHNIEADPRLEAPDEGEYAPIIQSPCRDAGSPDSPPDPDGSCTDIGVYQARAYAVMSGQTICERTGLPVSGVSVRGMGNLQGSQHRFETLTDENGRWNHRLLLPVGEQARFELSFAAVGFPRIVSALDIEQADTLRVTTRLPEPELSLNPAAIQVRVDSLSTALSRFSLRNYESSPLEWSARIRLPGDTSNADWSLQASIPVSALTGDMRIQGVVFDGTDYFAAGSSNADRNMIYKFSTEGTLTDSFAQPGSSRYGFNDLEWDGEWIWGGAGDTLYAIDRSGEVMRRVDIEGINVRNIAYNPDSGVFWVSGGTSDILAYDRDGHFLEETLDNDSLRIYGLAYHQNDPDGCPLYILHNTNSHSRLMKMNDVTGHIMPVASLPIENYPQGTLGLFCYLDLNRFDSWILVTVAQNLEGVGGERIDALRLRQFDDWLSLSPKAGTIPGGSMQEFSMTFDASNPEQGWQLPTGEICAEVEIDITGSGAKFVLPITLEVVEPNRVPSSESVSATEFLLLSPYPNPFNSSTTISYSLPSPGRYAIDVIDLQGRLVANISDGWKETGSYREAFDGKGIPSGVLILRLRSGADTHRRIIHLIR